MPAPCDTCTAPALVTWWHEPDQELAFCGHDSDQLADALVSAEWVQMVDEREAWAGAT